jgi:hypothetical protein
MAMTPVMRVMLVVRVSYFYCDLRAGDAGCGE